VKISPFIRFVLNILIDLVKDRLEMNFYKRFVSYYIIFVL